MPTHRCRRRRRQLVSLRASTEKSPSQFPCRDGRPSVDKVESSDGDPKFTFNNVETGLHGPCNYGPVVKALKRSGNQGDYKRCNYAGNFHKLWRLFCSFFSRLEESGGYLGFEAAQTGELEGKYTHTHTLKLWTGCRGAFAALSFHCLLDFFSLFAPRRIFSVIVAELRLHARWM